MCSNTCLSTLTGHYLNSFYPADAITLPYSLIEAAVGLANVAGAPLAAGLLLLDGTGGWAGWRWLFLIEGVPSVATGIAMLYVLPKDFAAATFLGAADKAWLAQVRWQQYDKFSWLFLWLQHCGHNYLVSEELSWMVARFDVLHQRDWRGVPWSHVLCVSSPAAVAVTQAAA